MKTLQDTKTDPPARTFLFLPVVNISPRGFYSVARAVADMLSRHLSHQKWRALVFRLPVWEEPTSV